MKQAALEWAGRGFRVFPLMVGGKRPAWKDWDWTQKASSDAADVEKWWSIADYNIGVLTNGLIVVDIDEKDGKKGTAAYVELELPWETLIVKTPTGGRHVYFSGPDRQNSAGRLARGLDVRGLHGYVVGPGSHIPSAGRYEIEADLPVAVAPDRLVDLLDVPRPSLGEGTAPLCDLDLPEALVRAGEYLAAAPASVEGDAGDLTAYRVAATLKDFGLSETAALDLMDTLWNERCQPPWSPEELAVKVENAYLYGRTPPGAFNPQVEFAGVSIPEPPPPAPPTEPSVWFDHGDPWNTETAWLLYKTLPQVGVAVLTAPPQAGKTFLALSLARALATGQTFFDTDLDLIGGTALLFAGTEGSGLAERMAALEEPDRLPISAMSVHGLRQGDALAKLQEALKAKSEAMTAEHGVPLRLIVLETLSASGLLEDENSNAEAAEAFAALANLSRNLNALVLVTHHPPKNGTGERGASAIRGSADYVLEIQREGKSTVRDLELLKGRNAPQRIVGSFTLVPVTLGIDSKGREVQSLVVSTGAPQTRLAKVAQFGQAFMEIVEAAMAEVGEDIEGKRMAPVDEVRLIFKERYPGVSRDPSNISKKWRELLVWAEDAGALEQTLQWGTKYIRLRTI